MKNSEQPFIFVGNNLAIDFINTQVTNRGEMIDFLSDSQDLICWADAAKLDLDESLDIQHTFKECLELRGALRRVFTAVLDAQSVPQNALNTINQHLLNHKNQRELISVGGELELRSIYKNLSAERLLGLIANKAACLLESIQLKKLKKCANTNCILFFVDTSKSGRRRWCSMDVCGNRSKAANHYTSSKRRS